MVECRCYRSSGALVCGCEPSTIPNLIVDTAMPRSRPPNPSKLADSAKVSGRAPASLLKRLEPESQEALQHIAEREGIDVIALIELVARWCGKRPILAALRLLSVSYFRFLAQGEDPSMLSSHTFAGSGFSESPAPSPSKLLRRALAVLGPEPRESSDFPEHGNG